jgi:hypothetical protein
MKKTSMEAIVNFINANAVEELYGVRDELNAELNKGAEKAEANRALYAKAHDAVVKVMQGLTEPATIGDLFVEVESELPEGFTKSKLQYGITRLWSGEFVKTEGKVNTYALKA